MTSSIIQQYKDLFSSIINSPTPPNGLQIWQVQICPNFSDDIVVGEWNFSPELRKELQELFEFASPHEFSKPGEVDQTKPWFHFLAQLHRIQHEKKKTPRRIMQYFLNLGQYLWYSKNAKDVPCFLSLVPKITKELQIN